jgi:HD domain
MIETDVLNPMLSLSERADQLEAEMMRTLDRVPATSVLYTSGDLDPRRPHPPIPEGALMLLGEDPRLPKLPPRPTLLDFFKSRISIGDVQHLLQSANLALRSGHPEKIVIACLLHDIAVGGFIRADHGYWGAQLVEPYVDEEVSWAIRAHQVLRFYADESVGYEYPKNYVKWFGADFRPQPYVEAAYLRARNHRWYMTGRLITLNDLYAFDPNVVVDVDDFTDIIGRNFKQPPEGLGFDNTPASHMWRTMMMPTRFL